MDNTVAAKLEKFEKTLQTGTTGTVSSVPNNSKRVITEALQDMVKSLQLIEAEKDHIKDIAQSLKNNHQIKPKVNHLPNTNGKPSPVMFS